MEESSNPNVNFSVVNTCAFSAGWWEEEKAFIFTNILCVWGNHMWEQSQMLNTTSSAPILDDTKMFISLPIYFHCFRKRRKKIPTTCWSQKRILNASEGEGKRVRAWWSRCLLAQRRQQRQDCLWWGWSVSQSPSELSRHFQAARAVMETFRLIISHDIVQGCAKKCIFVQHCYIAQTINLACT